MSIVDDEWMQFISGGNNTSCGFPSVSCNTSMKKETLNKSCKVSLENDSGKAVPVCDDLYISTKTKVLFLNQEVDIQNVFWKIPIIEYGTAADGVTKKQMKIVSKSPEEYEEYRTKLVDVPYYTENIIKQIDNASGRRIKYKDERKITIGLSKKDIMNCRGKVKNAFYNCFATIFRFKYDGLFREIHVKVFNTGKLEIPGILNPGLLVIVKRMLLETIQPFIEKPIEFIETDSEENVLINSNFNCGYFINRERLHTILRSDKYRIETAYDPCSYPGVKCKYYFNNELGFDQNIQNGQIIREDRGQKMSELGDNNKYTEVSFMIFRTGSCLIVGNCTERVLKFVFEFIKKILVDEYQNIYVANEEPIIKNKKTKLRKKVINVTSAYYVEIKGREP
uniref:Uncharacterized protein n=1 Tax=viral metagenome TaxID=1070528 RepID=A0A6C0L813_9ZZZZ